MVSHLPWSARVGKNLIQGQLSQNSGRMTFSASTVARIKIKTIEEMAVDKAEARANASAADKGKMTGSAPKSH
jgi:phosphohistidine phosphatase SixA